MRTIHSGKVDYLQVGVDLPSGITLQVIITSHGQAVSPGTRRARYTVMPDEENGINGTGTVRFSYHDRGGYLQDAAHKVTSLLRAAAIGPTQ